jgi:cation diffusion facilitator CzcD-associated flavoprotein CzcO
MTRVAIIGAGPYGLSIAAHLRSHGIEYRIFGTPMDTWRHHVPAGMLLKSDGFASSLSDPDAKGTLALYCAARGLPYDDTHTPVVLENFNDYAVDFQQRFVPDLEDRQVVSVEKVGKRFTLKLDNDETLNADFVVNAVGITHFARMPQELAQLPADLVTHSSAHHDLSAFAGRDVTVIGAGSSAIDIATLLHEAGAKTSLIARSESLRFSTPSKAGPRSRWQRLRHPSSGLGPGLRSWLFQNAPAWFRYLPGDTRLTLIRRHLGPQAAGVMKARFDAGVSVSLGERVERATVSDGRVTLTLRSSAGGQRQVTTDHVIAATGYWPDVNRLAYLSESLRSGVKTHSRMPVVSRSFESSVPGLYFVGYPAVNSFGPLMRFMVGAEYVAPVVARHFVRIASPARSPQAVATT